MLALIKVRSVQHQNGRFDCLVCTAFLLVFIRRQNEEILKRDEFQEEMFSYCFLICKLVLLYSISVFALSFLISH